MTDTFVPRFPYGSLTQSPDGTWTAHFERRLGHPILRVWQAITHPDLRALWIGPGRIEPRVGGEFFQSFANAPADDPAQSTGHITAYQPPHRLAYTWQWADEPASEVSWTLEEDGDDATRLTFTHSGLTQMIDLVGTGWHDLLDALSDVLDGSRTSFHWSYGPWEQLYPHYAVQPGVPATPRPYRPETLPA